MLLCHIEKWKDNIPWGFVFVFVFYDFTEYEFFIACSDLMNYLSCDLLPHFQREILYLARGRELAKDSLY